MKCNKCGKEINENEVFCTECKKELKNISSRSELRELESLIEEQKKLTDFEQTKELKDLEELNIDDLPLNENPKDLTKELENIVENRDKPQIGNREERYKDKNEKILNSKRNKILIIVFSIIFILVLGLLISVLIPKREKNDVIELDYRKIINEYGESVKKIISDYKLQNNEIPTWNDINSLINYKKHIVLCSTHNIYKDENIYLASCKVDGKDTTYTFGKEQVEVKEGKTITIYKENDSYNDSTGTKVGNITCNTETCEHISSYDKYSLIKENDEYYIYNYETNSIKFGPFKYKDILELNNKLYAVLYDVDGTQNMYSLVSSKTFKNVNGTLELGMNSDNKIFYKYGYAVFKNDNKFNFVNLKTGNISYSITSTSIGVFSEDTKNNLVYIAAYTENNKFRIYNSNGKALFDGEEYNTFDIFKDKFILSKDNEYKVYDANLNLITSSKSYDKILGIYEDFIVVLNKNKLQIMDTTDTSIVSFLDEWKNTYTFNKELSGFDTLNEKYGIYLTVQDSQVPLGTLGSVKKFYYLKDTKEQGVFESNSLS